ncbi:MAG: hypothetical protein IJ410_01985 [Oscillospiraceae bacterium]|nr:hypothetical protein [Oscillospiraceae bacterium]
MAFFKPGFIHRLAKQQYKHNNKAAAAGLIATIAVSALRIWGAVMSLYIIWENRK